MERRKKTCLPFQVERQNVLPHNMSDKIEMPEVAQDEKTNEYVNEKDIIEARDREVLESGDAPLGRVTGEQPAEPD